MPPAESGEGRLRHRETPEPDSKTVSDTVSNQDDVSQRAASETEMEIDELEKSMSALRFVPPSVTKSKGRLGRKS
ncbi:hypothetical protein PHISCL_09183 [Aspergillus sclerotialis]|uniref:Uncharacterized protein n=1 Tax=Aspergillus sclerotialis TaxID=2070753 RepID=A0A3A2Z6K6_9EURO|nr:hypothetical protein PHISCL_09183 [Aspergillus sclerotialis]